MKKASHAMAVGLPPTLGITSDKEVRNLVLPGLLQDTLQFSLTCYLLFLFNSVYSYICSIVKGVVHKLVNCKIINCISVAVLSILLICVFPVT
jgi:TctA family transporter